MDFDTAKENIQPLASGRNAEQLGAALIAESDQEIQQQLYEQRKEFEQTIETYEGDDPLQPWYDYIVWIEQIYPKSGKESALHDLLSKCLALFERDERYFQDPRMIKLYIKYIDSEPNPQQFYEQLYNNGIGTMVADLYLCWAHYYDYCDNFEKAESVYRKGLDARAQPIELIEQAHKQFGFSMSQRILYKDESTQKEFRSSMDEQRLALTSLRAHKHRHVGSIRTGSAVKSYNPGRVEQQSSSGRHSNRKIQVFEDASEAPPTSPTASTSVVQTILNSTKKQENLREPGPWNKAKMKSHALFRGASSSKPSFSILEDDDIPPIPLPDCENNYARGIQLPKDFVRQNLPQKEFSFQMHRDEEPAKNTLYKYDKFMVFPAPDKCYSLEELWAYKWFKKRNIQNNFTRTQDAVWDNGYDIPIRLPPHFVRKNKNQEDLLLSPINFEDALANGQRKFGFNIYQIYTPYEEYSPDEILQAKWINGDLMSQKNAEMELTCGFERREEIYKRRSMALGGRKSILPRKSDSPRKSISARKSLAAPQPMPTAEDPQKAPISAEPTGTVKRTGLPKRKSVYSSRTLDALSTISETSSPPASRRKLNDDEDVSENHPQPNPIKFNIFEDCESTESQNNDQVFKVPQSAPVQKSRVSSAFQDEDLDGCTTQTFNFYIKSQSISTPKVTKPHAKLPDSECASSMRKGLDFDNDIDESANEMESSGSATGKQPFACRSIEPEPQYIAEQHEIYRQKLSAIMETTEECATVSSLAATASSKSSSAEDFDFTKNTNHQSSSAIQSMYRHQTVINNTSKISTSLNVSTLTNRENESKKMTTLGFEIHQDDNLNDKNDVTSQIKSNKSLIQNVDSSTKVSEIRTEAEVFDKTLPPAGQFHIYEDENIQKPITTSETQSKSVKMNITAKETHEKSEFEMSQAETMPSEWSSKSLKVNEAPSKSNNSIIKPTIATRSSTIVPATDQKNQTITNQVDDLSKTPPKTGFQIYREDTGLTLPVINFVEDRTEQLPPEFNTNRMNLTQMAPPNYETEKTEAMTVYMPEIPDGEVTMNKSNMFRANLTKMEPTKEMNQSVAYNRSIFQFRQDDTTTNVFWSKNSDDKMDAMSKIPNPLQISMINMDGNVSAFPMIPEMPTLPDIDFETETIKQNQSQAVKSTIVETTVNVNDKTNANHSIFNRSQITSPTKCNQSRIFINQSSVDRKTLVEQNAIDELEKMSISKKNLTSTIDDKASANKSIFHIQNDSIEENNEIVEDEKENHPIESSVKNTTVQNEMPKISFSSNDAMEKCELATKSFREKSKTAIDDEMYAKISPPMQTLQPDNSIANQSIFSKSKNTIDDEFYAMIKSPVRNTERTLAKEMLIVDTPSPTPLQKSVRESTVADAKLHTHQISQLKDPSMSLLEPMKHEPMRESTVHDAQTVVPTGRNSSIDDMTKAFSEDNPNTAMFSLHMPFIKNSTILMKSNEIIHNISEEIEGIKLIDDDVQQNIKEDNEGKPAEVSCKQANPSANETKNITTNINDLSNLNLKSIHIKEERLSIENKPVNVNKSQVNIDDELFEYIKEKDSDTKGFFNLSIQLTEAELTDIAPKVGLNSKSIQNDAPNFMICNPVSIRPSQFPMNETNVDETSTKNDDGEERKESLKEFQLDVSVNSNQMTEKQEEMAEDVIVVEDTEDLSAVHWKSMSTANQTRRDTMHSPLKNRFATNPKLNETISAVKEIDPFDIHLQNALLDDIDFIEYIKTDLDYVNITTRVRAIELNSDLDVGGETYTILAKIGQGSFGFVYSGKSTTTGKMYAFKQERPANLWEFYISLEIKTRIEDAKIHASFMSVDRAMIGHNSSIFVTEYCEYGSLFDVCNRHKSNTCRYLDEVIAMMFSEQMLSIVDHLHASNIIHGDIKPDNFLLMKKLSYGNNEIVIRLIDFGRSIDLNFFPPNQTFTSTLNTKNFVCTEMLENRPWKNQIDLFCLASTMYTLVCGKYMNIKKQPESKIRPYILSENLAPYLNVQLWEHVLYSLINVRDHNTLPDLQKLRLQIREAIVDNEHIIHDKINKFNAVLDS